MDGKVGVGETLRETFAIYRDQAGVLLPVAFWLFLAVAIAELLVEGDIVETVLGALAATVTAPIEALVASVLYFRLLDIEARSSANPSQASV